MKKFQGKTAQLTLGSALLAVFIVLQFIPGGHKAAQGFMMVLTFLPVTIYAMCCGIKKALVMVVAGTALSLLLLPLEVALSFAIPALLIGLAGGMFYGKRKRLTVILILSVMQMLQNVLELVVYYFLTDINFIDTYLWAVDLAYQEIPSAWLAIPLFNSFIEDMMICCIPCLAILVAGAKGIISFQLIRLLNSRLEFVMGPQADPKYIQQTQFKGPGISIAYFCVICICAIVVALPISGLVSYHFICAVAAALGLLSAILYLYYFYINRVRTQEEHQTRLILSFILMVTLPLGIFALPLVEIYLLKRESAS